MRRIRDYRREYQQRIARGSAAGKTRSVARGHARAGERPGVSPAPYQRSATLEQAVRLMKRGFSQRQAAQSVGVTSERLRRYLKENTEARREGGRWIIRDLRPVAVQMATRGKQRSVAVSLEAASDIGKHWSAVNAFLQTNNPIHLRPFERQGVRDTGGKFHPYETAPDVLRRLDGLGELHFIDIYSDVVPS